MKKMTILLPAFLLVFQSTTINATSVSEVSETMEVSQLSITARNVVNYLTALGYTVSSTVPIDGTHNFLSTTYINGAYYHTTTYTDGNSILGHEESPI